MNTSNTNICIGLLCSCMCSMLLRFCVCLACYCMCILLLFALWSPAASISLCERPEDGSQYPPRANVRQKG